MNNLVFNLIIMEFYELKTEAKEGIKPELISYIIEKNKEIILSKKDAFLGVIMPYYFRTKSELPYSKEDISALELIALSISNPEIYILDGRLKDWFFPDIRNVVMNCKKEKYSASINENESIKRAVMGIVGYALNSNDSSEIEQYIMIIKELNENNSD
ncbi:MAG: hypothetical protein PHN19_05760 [Patescibacteria group bacterium]|nr:hypothetical protein [Patescibacteria group bacterium]